MNQFDEKEKREKNILETVQKIYDDLQVLKANNQPFEDAWIDNVDLANLLKVSLRTLQAFRDKGLISFTKFGGKIFYKAAHVEEILKKNYVEGFRLGK